MAAAESTEVFNCTPQEFYSLISDYSQYPQFLTEVKNCTVVEVEKTRKLVKFEVFLLKKFSYRLWITEEKNKGIHWEFDSGDLFKVSNGFWKLKDFQGKTQATYGVEAQFKLFVPSPIAKALVNVNLPNMMSSYQKRVQELYGK